MMLFFEVLKITRPDDIVYSETGEIIATINEQTTPAPPTRQLQNQGPNYMPGSSNTSSGSSGGSY